MLGSPGREPLLDVQKEQPEKQPEEYTKLRDSLIFSHHSESRGEAAFVVKDPETGRFFRFKEIEHFIAKQFDGVTPSETIRRRVEDEYKTPLSAEGLEQFVKSLRRLGLLEGKSSAQRREKYRDRGPVRGSLLYLRVKLCDPATLFSYLLPKIRWCFTPYFLIVSTALILAACGLILANAQEIGSGMLSLVRIDTIFLFWLTMCLLTTAHEFAHGLTCTYYGGKVRELGFMLMYLQPAFYCNVSDAWLFPEKSKRLWVTVAGPYFELVLAAAAVVIWRLADGDTWLSSMALIAMGITGGRTLLNCNPLIKLDGYYFLSDFLDLPNLRKRAFQYLWGGLAKGEPLPNHDTGSGDEGLDTERGLSKDRSSSTKVSTPVTSRERLIFLVYGSFATIYSLSLVTFAAMKMGAPLIKNYQASGFFLFLGLFGIYIRKKIKRVARAAQEFLSSEGAFRRLAIRTRNVGIPLVVLVGMMFLVEMDLRISGEFHLFPSRNLDVRTEVDGLVTEILVKEGDSVAKGTVVAKLSDRDSRADLAKTEAEIEQLGAKLKMLQAGPRREEIDVARQSVETAGSRLEKAVRQYEEAQQMQRERLAKAKSTLEKAQERVKYKNNEVIRLRGLADTGLISRKDLDAAEEERSVRNKEEEEASGELSLITADNLAGARNAQSVAEKELSEVDSRLRVLLAGSRKEELESTQAEIDSLEAHHRYLFEQIRLLVVVAPGSGTVTTPTNELRDMLGHYVKKGDLIASVQELTTVRAEISISEKEIADVQPGQKVLLKARAFPETSFEGTVLSVATKAKEKVDSTSGSTLIVLTELDNPSMLLKPDMTGNAKIFCGPRTLFDIMTRRIARYFRVEFWSWW
jgi:putative peptide zinc metalloprotease protein